MIVSKALFQKGKGEIHILGGCGVEGVECIRYLWKKGYTQIVVHDMGTKEDFGERIQKAHVALTPSERENLVREILSLPITFRFHNEYLKGILESQVIFAGQNWRNYPANYPLLSKAEEKGIPILNMINLYFYEAPCPIIGVTGTNGKTTVCHLLLHLLKQEKKIYLSGNDIFHPQCLHKIHELGPKDFLLLEISNRHLQFLSQSPHIAVLTSISEDHLDEHKGFPGYWDTKMKIFRYQTTMDKAIIPSSLAGDIQKEGFRSQFFTFGKKGHFRIQKGWLGIQTSLGFEPILAREEFPLLGKHNLENGLAALGAAYLAGLSKDSLKKGLATFRGVKNRLQLVQKLKGISFYNDLASTSPSATLAALRSLSGRIFWIGGGDAKGADYSELIHFVNNEDIVPLLLPGTVREELQSRLVRARSMETLHHALQKAWKEAEEGDIVLLSPAGAHFYSHILQNGRISFIRLVKKLRRAS